MDNFLLLVATLFLGMLLRRSGRLPDNAHAAINGVIINVSLPAVTLLYVHNLKLSAALLFPVAMAWSCSGSASSSSAWWAGSPAGDRPTDLNLGGIRDQPP